MEKSFLNDDKWLVQGSSCFSKKAQLTLGNAQSLKGKDQIEKQYLQYLQNIKIFHPSVEVKDHFISNSPDQKTLIIVKDKKLKVSELINNKTIEKFLHIPSLDICQLNNNNLIENYHNYLSLSNPFENLHENKEFQPKVYQELYWILSEQKFEEKTEIYQQKQKIIENTLKQELEIQENQKLENQKKVEEFLKILYKEQKDYEKTVQFFEKENENLLFKNFTLETIKGHQNITEYFQNIYFKYFLPVIKNLKIQQYWVPNGNTVVVESEIQYQLSFESEVQISIPAAHFFKFENSQIIEYRIYQDLSPLKELIISQKQPQKPLQLLDIKSKSQQDLEKQNQKLSLVQFLQKYKIMIFQILYRIFKGGLSGFILAKYIFKKPLKYQVLFAILCSIYSASFLNPQNQENVNNQVQKDKYENMKNELKKKELQKKNQNQEKFNLLQNSFNQNTLN